MTKNKRISKLDEIKSLEPLLGETYVEKISNLLEILAKQKPQVKQKQPLSFWRPSCVREKTWPILAGIKYQK